MSGLVGIQNAILSSRIIGAQNPLVMNSVSLSSSSSSTNNIEHISASSTINSITQNTTYLINALTNNNITIQLPSTLSKTVFVTCMLQYKYGYNVTLYIPTIGYILLTTQRNKIDLLYNNGWYIISDTSYHFDGTHQDKIIGTGAVGAAQQGRGLAMSADGDTIALGGPLDNSGVGAVWVFIRDPVTNTWSQQGNKLVGTGAIGTTSQGRGLALSGDGNTLATGGVDDNSQIGAVWVFTRSNGVWSQQAKLVGTGNVGQSRQGYNAVTLSYDGNIVAFGGEGDNSTVGAVWIFKRSSGTWTQYGNKIVPTDFTAGTVGFGFTVSLNNDGTILSASGDRNNSGEGAVWVFKDDLNGTYVQQGNKIVGTGAIGATRQGTSQKLSGDGSTLVVGGPNDNSNIGAFWIFKNIGSTWQQFGTKIISQPTVAGSLFSYGIAISHDGTTIFVGSPLESTNRGTVYMYKFDLTETYQLYKIIPLNVIGGAQIGVYIVINSDGTIGAATGMFDNSNVGAGFIFSST